jgi:predicted membrane GTPase involved in stress response
MVDGCLLVVDVTEGPMAQTKFVLSKALTMGLHPLVVFNKIDRPTASSTLCDLVHGQLLDLFSSLGATEPQLDFPVVYASGVNPKHRNCVWFFALTLYPITIIMMFHGTKLTMKHRWRGLLVGVKKR